MARPFRIPVILVVLAVGLPGQGGASVAYSVTQNWGTGFGAAMSIANAGGTAIAGWALEFTYPHLIGSHWDVQIAALGSNRWRATGTWNATIPAAGSVSFGFNATPNGAALADPSQATLNGVPVPVNGTGSGPACPTTPPVPLGPPPPAPPPGSGRRVIGYFAAWGVYGRNYHVPDIAAEKLTHINYAFANIGADLRIALGDPYADIDRFYPGDSWAPGALRGSFNRLRILKQQHPHVRTLISVGGWTWSSRFSDAALTAASRAAFAQSCADFVNLYSFDGVDIDWEYPVCGGLASNVTRPADRQNYTLLLAELRARLDALAAANGRPYLLTIAAPAGPATYAHLELGLIHPYLDWLNVMAYDFHGSWSPFTNFHNALHAAPGDPSAGVAATQFNAAAAVQAYLAAGIPPSKIVIGAPFYGRGWSGVAAANDGLWQGFTGLPAGTWEAGVFDFQDIQDNLLPTGWVRHWHPQARVPWAYSPAAGVMISYEDEVSLDEKAAYVNASGLGGVMAWELSADDGAHSLLGVLHDRLIGPQLWLQAATSGNGAGDLWLRVTGDPPAASHVILLASAAAPPGGPGTGSALGLVPDPLLLLLLATPPAPQSPLHWPVGASLYSAGPLTLPPCSAAGLSGQSWQLRAAAYDASLGLIAASGIATLLW